MIANYSGWSIPKNIRIVLSLNDSVEFRNEHFKLGYITHNNDTFETATRRLGERYTTFDTANENFDLQILRPRLGDKAGFWECLIHKETVEFVVYLYAQTIADLLLNSKFVNGICSKSVLFGIYKGQVGVLTTDMPIYEQVLYDKKIESSATTKKWQVGYVYSTKTKSDVLLGYFDYVDYSTKYVNNILTVDMKYNTNAQKVAIIGSYENQDIDRMIRDGFGELHNIRYMKTFPARVQGPQIFVEGAINEQILQEVMKLNNERQYIVPSRLFGFVARLLSIYSLNPQFVFNQLCLLHDFFGVSDYKDKNKPMDCKLTINNKVVTCNNFTDFVRSVVLHLQLG